MRKSCCSSVGRKPVPNMASRRTSTGEIAEAGARDLGGARHVDGAEELSELQVVPWREAEVGDGPDAAELDGVVLATGRSEEHTSELQSRPHLVCRLLLEKQKQ